MDNGWILVIDSGNGGIWTLKKIRRLLPFENYLFFEDKINAPYGNKSKKRLKKIVLKNLKKLTKLYNIKLVVFACNTISSVCYDYIKQIFFNLPIIKIEPYINANRFLGEQTLLLATKNTIKHNAKIKLYNSKKNIFVVGYKTLAKKIDCNINKLDDLLPYLNETLKRFKHKKIKNIVLGCTHFNYIKPQLIKIFGNVKFFENSNLVAKNVKKTLKKLSLNSNSKKIGSVFVISKI